MLNNLLFLLLLKKCRNTNNKVALWNINCTISKVALQFFFFKYERNQINQLILRVVWYMLWPAYMIMVWAIDITHVLLR